MLFCFVLLIEELTWKRFKSKKIDFSFFHGKSKHTILSRYLYQARLPLHTLRYHYYPIFFTAAYCPPADVRGDVTGSGSSAIQKSPPSPMGDWGSSTTPTAGSGYCVRTVHANGVKRLIHQFVV